MLRLKFSLKRKSFIHFCRTKQHHALTFTKQPSQYYTSMHLAIQLCCFNFCRYEAIIMTCSYSLYLILMYVNPTIEKYVYRITNTVKEHLPPEHHLGYTGLAPARDDGTDEFCAEHHQKHDEGEEAQADEHSEMNEAAILMINADDEVEVKTDVGSSLGTPDKGNVIRKRVNHYDFVALHSMNTRHINYVFFCQLPP